MVHSEHCEERLQDTPTDWINRLAPFSPTSPESEVQDSPQSAGESLLLTVSRPAMACEFEVLLNHHQYPQATDQAVECLDLIEELEALFSVYKPRSDLSILNRFGAERPIPASFDTLQLVQLAKAVHGWTGGAFDITAGSLSEVWGFARRKGNMPTAEEIGQALEHVGSERIQVDESESCIALREVGMTVNPGGIGKGYALDRAAGRLWDAGVGDFMMHGGLSSIVARGHRQQLQLPGGWQVSLKHPMRWEQHLGTICLRDCALGTSGSGKQFFHFKGQRYSHIIDPRSGWPAQGMMSATVLCKSAAVADSLATALFVMGKEAAREFCEEHQQISAILVYQDSKTGQHRIETLNMDKEVWFPA